MACASNCNMGTVANGDQADDLPCALNSNIDDAFTDLSSQVLLCGSVRSKGSN